MLGNNLNDDDYLGPYISAKGKYLAIKQWAKTCGVDLNEINQMGGYSNQDGGVTFKNGDFIIFFNRKELSDRLSAAGKTLDGGILNGIGFSLKKGTFPSVKDTRTYFGNAYRVEGNGKGTKAIALMESDNIFKMLQYLKKNKPLYDNFVKLTYAKINKNCARYAGGEHEIRTSERIEADINKLIKNPPKLDVDFNNGERISWPAISGEVDPLAELAKVANKINEKNNEVEPGKAMRVPGNVDRACLIRINRFGKNELKGYYDVTGTKAKKLEELDIDNSTDISDSNEIQNLSDSINDLSSADQSVADLTITKEDATAAESPLKGGYGDGFFDFHIDQYEDQMGGDFFTKYDKKLDKIFDDTVKNTSLEGTKGTERANKILKISFNWAKFFILFTLWGLAHIVAMALCFVSAFTEAVIHERLVPLAIGTTKIIAKDVGTLGAKALDKLGNSELVKGAKELGRDFAKGVREFGEDPVGFTKKKNNQMTEKNQNKVLNGLMTTEIGTKIGTKFANALQRPVTQ